MLKLRRRTPAYLAGALLAAIMVLAAACVPVPPRPVPPTDQPPAAPTAAPAPLSNATGRLTGNVTYRERIALPPNAVVEVTLQDVSRAGAPATILATQTIAANGAQAPIPFALDFDPTQIVERNTYAVRARITEDGQLTWTSTQQHPVLTRGAPVDNVEIIVERVASAPAPSAPGLTGVLTGTLTYMARIALTPDAVVDVTLRDMTDRPAKVIASQTFETRGAQAPIPYQVAYDPAQIDPGRTYELLATIVEGGEITWVNLDRYPVLTQGAKMTDVDIVLTQAPESAGMAGPEGVITGTVTYLQRIALPPTAVIQVQLLDISLQDVPAKVLASRRYIAGGRQVPIPFELSYEPAQIDPRHTYAVAARITIDNQLRWISTQQYPVLTRDAPASDIEIVVQPVP